MGWDFAEIASNSGRPQEKHRPIFLFLLPPPFYICCSSFLSSFASSFEHECIFLRSTDVSIFTSDPKPFLFFFTAPESGEQENGQADASGNNNNNSNHSDDEKADSPSVASAGEEGGGGSNKDSPVTMPTLEALEPDTASNG